MSDSPAATPPLCPKCGSDHTARVKRAGFMQESVLTQFGLYPWECSICRKVFTAKNRGSMKRRRRKTRAEVDLPPIS